VEVRLVDENDCEVPRGSVGEMIVRTDRPWAMNHGYYKNPEATAAAWRNGWFHTGDAFRQDEDGYFYFVDRVKDAIRRRGENISSFEVEAEVIAHPDVQDAAAVGVASEFSEDEVLIAVAPRPGLTVDPAELIEFLAARMPHFMVPRYVRILEELAQDADRQGTQAHPASGRHHGRHLGPRSRRHPPAARASLNKRPKAQPGQAVIHHVGGDDMKTDHAGKSPLAAGIALALGTAFATSGAAAQEERRLEEILVTATRVAARLEDIPAPISAVFGDDISVGGIQDIGDLQYSIPNLSVGQQFGVNRTFIRGIGMSSIELGADGAVAFHQDGALIARPSAQIGTYFDIDRVEVLRGPQGTLYGRGATAGAINLITRRPGTELEGNVSASAGNYGLLALEGGVGGPLAGESVLFRVAGKIEERDGYGTNLFTGSDVNDRSYTAARATLQFLPTDDLEITVTGDFMREDDSNYAFSFFGPTTIDPLFGQLFGGRTIFDVDPSPDPWDINADVDPENNRRGAGLTVNLDWTLGDWKLQSITAYRDFERTNVADLDSTDFDAFGRITYTEESETLGQEFLLYYTQPRWDLLAGAMYFREELFASTLVPLNNIEFVIPGAPQGGIFNQRGDLDIDAYGVFLQGTYRVTDQLSITGGARYSYEKRDHVGAFTFTALGVIDVPTSKSDSWGAWTPRLTVDYRLADGTLLYGNISRGFKSGVINIGALNDPLDPEFVWNYEVGVKTTVLEDRVRIALSAFHYDYKDLQVSQIDEFSTPITENAAEARNRGVELELNALLTEALSVDFYATYLRAEFREFETAQTNRIQEGLQNLRGNRLPNAPDFTWTLAANYTLPVAGGDLRLRGEAAYVDDVFFTEFNNSDAFQEGYTLLNASVRYSAGDSGWSVEAWGRNLSNESVKANNIVTAPLFAFATVGSRYSPRTYGLTIGYRF
jgi:iron complex outermembrane recepter protein